MDVFLIGFRPSAPTYSEDELAARVAARPYGAALIRDWSSLTTDDTRWRVVVDAPDAPAVHEVADELGVEILGTVRIVPDRAMPEAGSDWVARMSEVLPNDPPPPLAASIAGGGDETELYMTLPPNLDACSVCGWIGDHDPAVQHPNPP